MIKKTYNINLAGRQFVIDDDAYTMANNYLDTIEHLVRDPEERAELTSDIEDRMAELLDLNLEEHNSTIVTISMIEAVIARIGQPNDFIETEEEVIIEKGADDNGVEIDLEEKKEPSSGSVPPPPSPGFSQTLNNLHQKISRRLFRDPRNSVFGGVCSGIAHFLRIDPVWVRLIFVLLALGMLNLTSFSWMAFIYILLWIIVPPADTPLKRMEMMGEAPTLGNIAKTVTDDANVNNCGTPGQGNAFTKALQVIGQGIMLFLGVLGVPVLIALILGILGVLFVLIACASGFTFGRPELMSQIDHEAIWGMWTALGVCVTLFIPTFLMVWYLFKTINPSLKLSRTMEIIMAIIWVVAFVFTAICVSILDINGFF